MKIQNPNMKLINSKFLRNDNITDKYISTKPSDKYIEVITTNRKKNKKKGEKKILMCMEKEKILSFQNSMW